LTTNGKIQADLFLGSLAVWASQNEATISSFSLAEFGLLKFYRISVLVANSLKNKKRIDVLAPHK